MKENDILYDLIKELKEGQKEIKEDIGAIKDTLHENTLSLKEHIRRTEILESIADNHKCRISKLETPSKIKEFLYGKTMKWAALISTILGIVIAVKSIM